MVMGAGTDADYTRDIPIRVSHLETSVNQLHIDNQRTQSTLAGIVAQQESQGRLLADIANKLDQTRTQKPNLPAVIAAVGVMITISVLAFAPVYRELSEFRFITAEISAELNERGKIIANSVARLDHIEDRQRANEQRLLGVEANRFTKQDGQLLDEILRAEIWRSREKP